MDYSLKNFKKRCDKVICIDSDGTMIDAMNVKHDRCHGATFIDVFGLKDHADEIHETWDSINLYEKTRGINRFIAIVEMFKRVNGKYIDLNEDDLAAYTAWVEKGNLSHDALVKEYEKNPNPLIKEIIEWSETLLKRIAELTPDDKPPYENGKEALEYAKGRCDIAIISSSNMAAIMEEWKAHDLLKYVDVITSQEVGTKGECLSVMLEKGYKPTDVLMIGDAYPDVDAANENGVYYYPILTRHEAESWKDFIDKYFDDFIDGKYEKDQKKLLKKFEDNFDTGKKKK
ncbi:MAG: HAD family hydrolase [Firmicutes bacterium]|nr:HAD family hydrolase [Bacillota bacterium]